MSSAEEPRERAQALRAIDEQLDALGGDEARGRTLARSWIGDADREALLADLEANAPSIPSEPRRTFARAVTAHGDDEQAPESAPASDARIVGFADASEAETATSATSNTSDAERTSSDAERTSSDPDRTTGDTADARWSDDDDRAADERDVADDGGDTPMFGVAAVAALEPEEPSHAPLLAVAPPPMLDSIPPGHTAAPLELSAPVGVAVEPTEGLGSQRPSRGPASRRKSALPPPVRRSEAPPSMPPPDGRIAVPADVPRSSPPVSRASQAPRRSERPATTSRMSSVPPLDDGGLSLDLGEIGPAEGTRISQVDLPAENTHAHAMLASIEPATERGSVVPARPSDRPIMGSDPFAARDSEVPPPLADLFADADDVLFGPDASRPLSVAAPPPLAQSSDPARGSLEVDLEDLDSELDSFIEEAPESPPPMPPRTGRPRFTASDTVMAKPFDMEEAANAMMDESENTIVGSVEQFEELGMGLSAEEPQDAPQAGVPTSQPPLGGLRSTGAPPPPDSPRSKGFLKKLFGGK